MEPVEQTFVTLLVVQRNSCKSNTILRPLKDVLQRWFWLSTS